ncbi:hypothetical protein HPB47_001176 [Ixodes persulcatus]|uniref:Uncharacterized protein n=1 Tax=Ixodes persulcatus TaxID=34615 RepID=A0AC60PQ34_IXOPE|nr:hypothetical protein HPB47_001176 [Ixodes persulcatus]
MAAVSSQLNGVCLPVDKEPTVLLTGFGLFRDYRSNSSGEVVRALGKTGIPGVHLVVVEVPVEYEAVSTLVPKLWEQHRPALAVHCGMDAGAQALALEQVANNGGYCALDNQGAVPSQGLCSGSCPQQKLLRTNFDLDALCKKLKAGDCQVPVQVSNDAGRFMCEFIYYTSLNISPSTVFVHVPPVDKPFSVEQLSSAVGSIILNLLEQMGLGGSANRIPAPSNNLAKSAGVALETTNRRPEAAASNAAN